MSNFTAQYPITVGRAGTVHEGWAFKGVVQNLTICGTASPAYNRNNYSASNVGATVTCTKCIERLERRAN